jgi:hypothetical protein
LGVVGAAVTSEDVVNSSTVAELAKGDGADPAVTVPMLDESTRIAKACALPKTSKKVMPFHANGLIRIGGYGKNTVRVST